MESKNYISFFHVPASVHPVVKTSRVLLKSYHPSNSSWDKVKYILGVANRVLSAREIIGWIYEMEPELKSLPERKKKTTENNVHAILSNAVKGGRAIRFRSTSHKEYKYGFTIWINEDGKIKTEYLV